MVGLYSARPDFTLKPKLTLGPLHGFSWVIDQNTLSSLKTEGMVDDIATCIFLSLANSLFWASCLMISGRGGADRGIGTGEIKLFDVL